MIGRTKLWIAAAVAYAIINVGGAGLALAQGEVRHAAGHVVALFIGGVIAWWFGPWRGQTPVIGVVQPDEFDTRLTHLEQIVDTVAIEVERIGEGQRFITRLFTDGDTTRSPQHAAAQPLELDTR